MQLQKYLLRYLLVFFLSTTKPCQVNPADTPELRMLRPLVLTAAGFLGHRGVKEAAQQLLQKIAAAGGAGSRGVT